MSRRQGMNTFRRIFWHLSLCGIGFLIGLLSAFLIYIFVLSHIDIDIKYKMLLLASLCVFLSVGFSISTHLRCLAILTFPYSGSRGGRRALQASILILVLSGPLHNIGENGEEILRFLSCTKDMLVDIFKQGKDLLLAPIEHIIEDIREQEGDGAGLNTTALTQLMEPIVEEVEDKSEVAHIKLESDRVDAEMGYGRRSQEVEEQYLPLPGDSQAEKTELMYQKKLAYRCEEIFTKGTEKCKDLFRDKYDSCYDAVTWVLGWLLCWPMKLTFICDIIGEFSQTTVCDAAKVVEEGFGENYVAAKRGIADLKDSMQTKISIQDITKFSKLDEQLRKHQDDLLATFIKNRKRVEYVFELIRRTLAPSFLFIVRDALRYQNKYFQTLYFDNKYITNYFRKIDNRRKEQGRSHLLPLKSFEESDYTSVIRFSLTEEERKNFYVQLIIAVVAAGVTSTLFIFDYLFTNVLTSLKTHGNITIEQKGEVSLEFRIEGEGFIAQLLKKVIKDFSYAKEISHVHATEPCLPHPKSLDPYYYFAALFLFASLLLISYFEAHCLRTRHCIANYFFPKRCKKRILWRYNESLKKRKRQIREMKQRIADNVEQRKIHVDFNPIWALAEMFPKCCRCLKKLKAGRRKCILCKKYGEFFRCPNCNYSYCKECYEDMDSRCLFCDVKLEDDFQLNDENANANIV